MKEIEADGCDNIVFRSSESPCCLNRTHNVCVVVVVVVVKLGYQERGNSFG